MKTRRVRIYYPFFPFPPTEGAYRIVCDQIELFSRWGFEVELVCWKTDAKEVRAEIEAGNILGFPLTPLRLTLFNGSVRESTLQRSLRVFRSIFSDLSSPEHIFYPPSQKPVLEKPVDLALYHYSFAYPWMMSSDPHEGRRVVFFHNLESDLFSERAKETQNPIARWIHLLNAEKLQCHEGGLGELADELWFLSPEDLQQWQKRNPQCSSRLRFVPPAFFEDPLSNKKKKSRNPHPVLGFVGKLDFLPNQESVSWILRELAPRLQKAGFQGEIRIAGKGCPPALKRAGQKYPFVKWLGFVESLDSFWSEIDVSLVPHILGSGVRIKLLESLVAGVPVLANPSAVSRIHPDLRRDPLLWEADEPGEWVEKILALSLESSEPKRLLPPALDMTQIYAFVGEMF